MQEDIMIVLTPMCDEALFGVGRSACKNAIGEGMTKKSIGMNAKQICELMDSC